MSVEDTAEYLGISAKTIRNQLSIKDEEKKFPVKPKRFGKRVLFDIRDLDSYVDGLQSG